MAPAPAAADRGGATTTTTRVASADDEDDDPPAKPSKAKKRPVASDDDDDDEDADADADDDDADDDDADDEDDDSAARRAKWRKRPAASDDDDDEDEDDSADDDDDDARPSRKPTPKAKKRPVASDDDDDDADDSDADDDDSDGDDASADDDDDDDDGARKPRSTRRAHARRPADDDDDDDDDDDADDDDDDDDDDNDGDLTATTDDDDAPPGMAAGGPRVIEEVYIIPPKITVAAELLGAAPIDGVNSELFAMGGGAGLGLEYYLSPTLALHAAASVLYFRAGDAMETTSWAAASAGPRLHLGGKLFGASTHHDAWLDAHATFGQSGGIRRPGFDVGGALQWEVSPAVRLGPMLRWSFGSDPLDKNAQVITVGLALGVGGRTRQTIHVEGDADGDGLVDRLDECPGELPGDTADPGHPGCPVRDADGDEIPDDEDECTDEPAGDRPDVDRIGCPLPPIVDSDEDGVPDDDDRCPEQPGPARPGERTSGCPLARVQDQKIEILEQIFFEHDSATISEASQPVLEAVGKVIGELGSARISIEGHTSEDGTDSYNMDLSKRRARAVAQWLIENAGIAATRLDVKGWGKRRPLVSGAGADTSKNRRVEFLILEGK
jgi:outer membrane protein OmpA-like peptidoglycan-associated protein